MTDGQHAFLIRNINRYNPRRLLLSRRSSPGPAVTTEATVEAAMTGTRRGPREADQGPLGFGSGSFLDLRHICPWTVPSGRAQERDPHGASNYQTASPR